MAAPITTYRKLPGRGSGLVGYFHLYEGPDHLLQVASTGFSETYKRFYYRDIQSVVVHRTGLGKGLNWVFGILSLLSAIAVISFLASPGAGPMEALILGLVLAPFSVIPFAVNLLLGPTCGCHIRTAVQVEKLVTLGRIRNARRVLARLKPLIEAAQGPLAAEEIERIATGSPGADLAAPPIIGAPPVIGTQPSPLLHYHGRAHRILSWLLLADLPATALAWTELAVAEALGLGIFLGAIVAAVVAIVKQRGTDVPTPLRRLPWITLATAGVFFVLSIIYGIYLAIARQGRGLLGLSPMDDPVVLALTVVSTIISVALGCYGLWHLRQRMPPPSTQPPPMAAPPAMPDGPERRAGQPAAALRVQPEGGSAVPPAEGGTLNGDSQAKPNPNP